MAIWALNAPFVELYPTISCFKIQNSKWMRAQLTDFGSTGRLFYYSDDLVGDHLSFYFLFRAWVKSSLPSLGFGCSFWGKTSHPGPRVMAATPHVRTGSGDSGLHRWTVESAFGCSQASVYVEMMSHGGRFSLCLSWSCLSVRSTQIWSKSSTSPWTLAAWPWNNFDPKGACFNNANVPWKPRCRCVKG